MNTKGNKMKEKKSKVDLSADIPIHCSYSQLTAIQELNPNPRNYNKHPDEQIALLAKNIRALGWRHPIIVSKLSGKIVAGHARLEAAKLLSLQIVPVDFQSFNSQDEENAYLIADNKIAELAELDESQLKELLTELTASEIDMDLTGFTEQALSEILKQEDGEADAEPQIDNAEELNKVWQVKVGDVWTIGNHRLMCGDSTKKDDVDCLVDGKKADMVFADPPYGTGIDAPNGLGNAKVSMQMVGDKDTSLAKSLFESWIKFANTQVWFGANYYSSVLPDSKCWIVWDKDHHGMTFADAELAWVNSDSPVRIFKHAWSGNHKASEKGEQRNHPTQKPVALYVWAINEFGNESKIVIDPCLGSGTTMVACENLHRKCYGMEITPNYCAVILQRMKDAFPSLEIKRVE